MFVKLVINIKFPSTFGNARATCDRRKQNNMESSVVQSKRSLWPELQKAGESMLKRMVVFRTQTDTMPEQCAAADQRFKLKGAKKSIRLKSIIHQSTICIFHDHYEKKKIMFCKQNRFALLALSGIIILANTFQITRNNK